MTKKRTVTDEEFARDMKEAGVKMRTARARIGKQSATQETLSNIAWASSGVGYIQTNADGTHAQACCCRWCVSKRWNERKSS